MAFRINVVVGEHTIKQTSKIGNGFQLHLQFLGQFLGHCLRQPQYHPEYATSVWRNRECCGFNNCLSSSMRIPQHNQGRLEFVSILVGCRSASRSKSSARTGLTGKRWLLLSLSLKEAGVGQPRCIREG
eukprot:4353248-Amphidinium_carterae.1